MQSNHVDLATDNLHHAAKDPNAERIRTLLQAFQGKPEQLIEALLQPDQHGQTVFQHATDWESTHRR